MNSQPTPLGEITDIVRGVSYGANEVSNTPRESYLPILRAGNIQKELKFDEDLVWIPKALIRENQKIKKDDLVMCTSSGSAEVVGKIASASTDWRGSFGAFCVVVRAHPDKIQPSFLAHFLRSPEFKCWAQKSHGANIKNIRKSELEKFQIPLPILDEQRRITAILDKTDAIRKQRHETLKLADEFLRSVFLNMFGDPATNPRGWPVYSLGSLCAVQTGATPNRLKASYYGGHIPWVKTGEVDQDSITDTEEQITESGIKETNCKIFPVETILIAMYGQGKTRGKCGMLGIPAATNQACAAILPANSINGVYLYRLLKISYEAIRSMGRGGNQENLNLGMIKGLDITVPPEALQKQFAEIVKKTTHVKLMQQTLLADAESLFASISRMVFSGQL